VGELVREVKEYDRVGVEWEREFLGLGNISLSILSFVEWCNINCMLQGAVGAACYYGGSRLRSRGS